MQCPSLTEEKRLWRKGFRAVAGLDEAGRGPLAGPVVASAVAIENCKLKIENFKGVRDSKKLSFSQRKKLYKIITRCPEIKWGIGVVSNKIIDKINILEATKLAMERAIINLEKKLKIGRSKKSTIVGKIHWLILDGNFTLNTNTPQKPIVKADEKVFSCAAASILAKVTRDRIMRRYHRRYPRYRFDLHKGYPTRLHIKLLKKCGPSKIHRLSFRPVIQAKNLKRKA
ncbi:MAG: ribonuclease HII [Candidatus Wildermuthbacteria bacterium GWA2_46_15]|uniref:Ribonuclease n=1 Tax=Candidatus Wildermuthbacteria bacterium GWA2_46_15 TaxID=1802443 RepID=A0A1G2QP23_9BACT|nr:MAG: ribonuclease HII [Candidatus Wildermuthbacteria bacterium GWA2_46_15]